MGDYQVSTIEFAAGAIEKVAGEYIYFKGTLQHKGPAEKVYLSWGISPGSMYPGSFRENDIQWVQTTLPFDMGNDADWKTYQIYGAGYFPTNLPAPDLGAMYDVKILLQVEQGGTWVTTNGGSAWFDNAYNLLTQAGYRDIQATFS